MYAHRHTHTHTHTHTNRYTRAHLRLVELGNTAFKRLVNVLSATNEADRGKAVAVGVQGLLGSRDNLRVVGKAEVVVGAHVDDRLVARVDSDLVGLGRRDDALSLPRPGLLDGCNFLSHHLQQLGPPRACRIPAHARQQSHGA